MKYERTLVGAVDVTPTHVHNLNAMQTNRLSHFLLYAYAANESTPSYQIEVGLFGISMPMSTAWISSVMLM